MTRFINNCGLFAIVVCALSATTGAEIVPVQNTVYQVAPIAALAKGLYSDTTYTYGELKKHGDFGLGTFLNLDGEMIALDGNFYQMMADSRVRLVDDSQAVPFAEVNYFQPNTQQIPLHSSKDFTAATKELLQYFKNKNTPYAIRIDGVFSFIKLRAVRKQDAPFRSLVVATKNQAIFKLNNVRGTLIGYWFPEYLSGIAVTGFHLHFINDARTIGGHVLDIAMSAGVLNLQQLANLQLYFPNNTNFATANLSDKTIIDTVNKAENDRKPHIVR